MLRAVRLAAKLGLTIDPRHASRSARWARCSRTKPAARLFDEMLKLLFSGHSLKCLQQLREKACITACCRCWT